MWSKAKDSRWVVLAAVIAALAFAALMPAVCAAREYVVLVDCTGTMRYQGRGDATMQALSDFVRAVNPGDFVTIYGYGEEPFPALAEYPWRVESGDTWTAMNRHLTLPFDADRTDITKGLDLVWSERELVLPSAFESSSKSRSANSCVVLLTDGKLIPCYDDYSKYDSIYSKSRTRLLELAKLFGDAGISVYSIGLGSEDKVDGELLSEVSRRTGGKYLHSATSGQLAAVFGTLIAEIAEPHSGGNEKVAAATPATRAPVASVDVATAAPADAWNHEEPVQADEEPAQSGEEPMQSRSEWVDNAAASETVEPEHESDTRTPAKLGAYAARAAFKDIAGTVHQTVLGVLGVVVGFVAIGVQRKQSWTRAFTKPLLQREIRVKGYLRPAYPDGMVGARACIPIENPGLPAVEVGEGTEFGVDLDGVLVEIVGTVDGSPPTLRVLKGEVKINGTVVAEEQKLEDGDLLSFGDKPYTYLRGVRR